MPMCRVFSCAVWRGCLLWPVHFLGKTLLIFALLHSVLRGQIYLLILQLSLEFLLLHSSPLQWKGHLIWGLVLKGSVGLHRTIQIQLLQHYWLGYRLWLPWYWMICLGNEQRSLCFFETASKYCISDSFVDYDGYSISYKVFLPTAIDIMVIWVKFTHSSPF